LEAGAGLLAPRPAGHALGLELRAAAGAADEHQDDVARVLLLEARGLGRARVDGRRRRPGLDLAEPVRVADRQVVEPAPLGGVLGDREVRLVAVDVEGLAVDEADPDPRVARGARRE